MPIHILIKKSSKDDKNLMLLFKKKMVGLKQFHLVVLACQIIQYIKILKEKKGI